MAHELVDHVEGKTEFFVPRESLMLSVPPKEPAFYNPRGVESRDISIIAYETFSREARKPVSFADILCGLGARGIRVAKETSVFKIFLNDINLEAIELAKRNAEINSVSDKCVFSNDDTNHFLILNRKGGNLFDIIDVDPFGTPSPFIEDAVKTVRRGGMISLTATDTAVLCGIHPNVASRKYYGRSLHSEYCHEVGLRLLFGALALSTARYDKGIKPLFCHSTRHYLRIYAQIVQGAEEGDKAVDNMGYINHCDKCNWRTTSKVQECTCKTCGGRLSYGGPLWIGKIFDKEFVKEMKVTASKMNFKKYFNMLDIAEEEADGPPTYYLISMICDRLEINTPPIEKVIRTLKEKGFFGSRTIINNRAIRTDAPSQTVNDVLVRLANI
ncbi:MAG: tRNA (guanine(10)-N(2))-dimethyltransferase [Nitrososphaeria archaeon]